MLRNGRAKHGFTLIELLVVVAIIALLISILLPSLAQAREQAKVAACLANGRSLMQSTVLYLNDHQEGFPMSVKQVSGTTGTCSWMYGGKTSHDFWKTKDGGYAYHIIHDRPMNKYILGTEPEPDLMDGSGNILHRQEIPQLRCPGDMMSYQRIFDDPLGTSAKSLSAYEDIGTSYHFNLAFAFRGTGPSSQVDLRKQGMSTQQFTNWWWSRTLRGMDITTAAAIRTALNRGASTFVMYWEDPMDFAINVTLPGTPTMGQHKRFSVHTMLFLDGHVKNQKVDTRRMCGPGWTAQIQHWVPQVINNQTQQPTTEYYYHNATQRTCDPLPN